MGVLLIVRNDFSSEDVFSRWNVCTLGKSASSWSNTVVLNRSLNPIQLRHCSGHPTGARLCLEGELCWILLRAGIDVMSLSFSLLMLSHDLEASYVSFIILLFQ